ncbi:MAG: hypothetical protein WBP54_01590 [Pelodictyon phaeoclathratiforme]
MRFFRNLHVSGWINGVAGLHCNSAGRVTGEQLGLKEIVNREDAHER